jgi:uncharacterized membrane protein YkvA (DUF1232 family)
MKPNGSTVESRLAAFYFSEEGIDFDRFVEQGGQLIGARNMVALAGIPPALREKIATLRETHPRLARQLEFLEEIVGADGAQLTALVRREAAFALAYATNEQDLIPDTTPGIGYADDEAVAEAVISRHAETFARYCAARGPEWASLSPEGTRS